MKSLREIVGTRRLLMPSVTGIIRDAENRVLLVRQSSDGLWTTPGGSIDPGELPADAVVREVLEETGLTVRPLRVMAVWGGDQCVVRYANGDETEYVSIVFECERLNSQPQELDDEVTETRFFSLEEAKSAPLIEWLPRIIATLYRTDSSAWFESNSAT